VSQSDIFTIQKEKEWKMVRSQSHFIALSFHLPLAKESRTKLREAEQRFPRATHYAYAFRCGTWGDEEHASDGGEPRGSAGRPILGVLQHLNLTETMIVVVRYFGGKKLGIRGLIEAYGEATQKVLELSGRTLYVPKETFLVSVELPFFDLFVHRLLGILKDKHNVTLQKENATISFIIAQEQAEQIEAFLKKEHLQGVIRNFTKER
jgi:putative IMPACT (imprinted ancient) family translation regulator